jgi:hypothetical protein
MDLFPFFQHNLMATRMRDNQESFNKCYDAYMHLTSSNGVAPEEFALFTQVASEHRALLEVWNNALSGPLASITALFILLAE